MSAGSSAVPSERPALSPWTGDPSDVTVDDGRLGSTTGVLPCSAGSASVLFLGRGTFACLYAWSASHVVQRVCLTSSPTIATTTWLVSRRSLGQ